jgi:maltooligosyltrehalose synthase
MQTETTIRPQAPPVSTTHAHDRRKKKGRTLLARLLKLSSDFPEFRAAIGESLDLVKHQIERCPESDRQLILHAIHLGAWTMDELTDDSKLTRPEIQKILDGLLVTKTVIRKESQEKNKLGGRPKILWLPAPNYQPEP